MGKRCYVIHLQDDSIDNLDIMSSTQTTEAEAIMTDNVALRAYYESWDSRIVYQVIMGGTQHFGYWDKDTYWPFPLGSKLRR